MATFTATGAQAAVQPKGLRVGLVAVRSTYSINASVASGDVLQMVRVPANATPIWVQFGSSTTSGLLIFEVGDGIVSGRYRSLATYSAGQGMLTASINVTPYTYSQDDTIDLVFSIATAVSLTGAVYMNAIFSMDPGV